MATRITFSNGRNFLDRSIQHGQFFKRNAQRPTLNAQRSIIQHPASRMVIELRLDHEHEHEGRIPGCHRAIPA